MKAAAWPRAEVEQERLLIVDPDRETIADGDIGWLPELLRAGDLLVVNDAATLPASIPGTTARGEEIEVRLAGRASASRFHAVLFGPGDWRTRTEDRPPPPRLLPGDPILLGAALSARVEAVAPATPRLVTIAFAQEGTALLSALYRHGRPVQYSHVAAPLRSYHVQTAYAGRPWAFELPSAGRPLSARLLLELRRRGVRLATVTHAAGLSSTGDPTLDAHLPLPEAFEIPQATVDAIAQARARGGCVIAVGTSTVRALEGAAAAHGGTLVAGEGVTDLVLGPRSELSVVDGLLTGMHERGTSHRALLAAFVPGGLLDRAYDHAERSGYLGHEFGDLMLVCSRHGTSCGHFASRDRASPRTNALPLMRASSPSSSPRSARSRQGCRSRGRGR